MKRSTLENSAPKMSRWDFTPYVLFFVICIAMGCYVLYLTVGPVLTTAIVLATFLTTSIIIGLIERDVREDESEE